MPDKINMSDIITSIIHTEEYNIVTKYESLVMLDTRTKKSIIVDIEEGLLVSPGFNIYEEISGPLPEGEYYLGREGIDICVYQYKDNIHVSTSNCINIDDMIFRTKIVNVGLDINSLFPSECKGLGDISYHYIISHRDDIVASKINMYHREGFAYYISHHCIRDGAMSLSKHFQELNVPYEIANDFLIRGYHPDVVPNEIEQLQLGEFINVITTDGKYVRVLSPSYTWRKKLRENDTKIRYGFYKHLTLAMKAKKDSNPKNTNIIKSDYDEYVKLFPIIPYVEPRSIESYIKIHGFILSWPKIGKLTTINYVFNTWACYILAMPLHLHNEVSNLYNDYYNVCFRCHKYIVELWKSGAELLPNIQYSDSIDTIAIRRIDDIIKQSMKNIGENKLGSFEKNCHNLIKKERGSSLYAINEYIVKRIN